jgi:TPR repeat protein
MLPLLPPFARSCTGSRRLLAGLVTGLLLGSSAIVSAQQAPPPPSVAPTAPGLSAPEAAPPPLLPSAEIPPVTEAPAAPASVPELITQVEAGDTEALLPLALAYRSGTGVEQDLNRAAELFTQAAQADVEGADAALVGLGYTIKAGNGVPADPVRASQIFQSAVDAGVAEALLPLGFAYRSGEGVDRAIALFTQALEAGVEGAGGALVGVGYALNSGEGVPEDPERAVAIFNLAHEAGAPEALLPLGFAYRSGKGVEQDVDRAIELFVEASRQGVEGASGALVGLGYAFNSGNGLPRDPARAVEIFKTALDAGAMEALVPLGFAYRSGNGVRADSKTAIDYFRRAAAQGMEGGGTGLRFIDANAYVSLLQEELIARDLLSGTPDGRANQRTIRAFLQFCRQAGIERVCQKGPLDPDAIEAVIKELAGDA